MKSLISLCFLFVSLSTLTVKAQHILKREYGVVYNINNTVLISPPNLSDGWGSSADGLRGDSISFYYEEQNNSYNGVDLVGSSWMSYGDLLPLWLPGIVSVGVGFTPDTFRWDFTADSIFASVKDAETSGVVNYRFEYLLTSGSVNGIDSLHLYDSIVTEPSLVKVYDDISSVPVGIRDKYTTVNMDIFPNPSSDQVFIRLPDDQLIDNVIIQDISGKSHLSQKSVNSATTNLNMKGLPIGLYIVNIETQNGLLYYKKLVVK